MNKVQINKPSGKRPNGRLGRLWIDFVNKDLESSGTTKIEDMSRNCEVTRFPESQKNQKINYGLLLCWRIARSLEGRSC